MLQHMINLLLNSIEESKARMHLMLLQEMQDGKQIKKEMLKAVKEQTKMKTMNFYSQRM